MTAYKKLKQVRNPYLEGCSYRKFRSFGKSVFVFVLRTVLENKKKIKKKIMNEKREEGKQYLERTCVLGLATLFQEILGIIMTNNGYV
jgi:hypothetical protein